MSAKARLAPADAASEDSDDDEDDEPVSRRAGAYGAKPVSTAEPMALDAAHYVSGSVMATSDSTGGRCETPLTRLAGVSEKSLCIRSGRRTMVLTDLYAGGSCPAEVYLVVGDFSAIRLVLAIPARTALHQTGARIFYRAARALVCRGAQAE